MESYDLRSALADALPAAGPTRSAVKAMDDIGYKADPKNNDMKELFVGLDIEADAAEAGSAAAGGGGGAAVATAAGPSAAQVLLDYRREQKAAQQAAEEQAKAMAAAGKSPAAIKNAVGAGAGVIKGVGLSRAAGLGGQEMEEAAEDERYLRKANLSKTAAKMSSKQKRRRKAGKEHGASYEDKYAGKVVNKSKRKGRMLAMKQMY